MLRTAIIAIMLLTGITAANAQGKVFPCSVEFVEDRTLFGIGNVKISAWTKAKSKNDRLATIISLATIAVQNMPYNDVTVFLFDPEKIKTERGWGIDKSVAFLEYAPTPKNIANGKPIWKGSLSIGEYDKKDKWYKKREKIGDELNNFLAWDYDDVCGWQQIQKTLKKMNTRVNTEAVNLSGIPDKHRRFLQNIASAFVFEGQCKKLQISTLALGMLMLNNGINERDFVKNGRYSKAYNSMFSNNLKVYYSEPTSQVCWTANYLYGPKGIEIPNLMIPR